MCLSILPQFSTRFSVGIRAGPPLPLISGIGVPPPSTHASTGSDTGAMVGLSSLPFDVSMSGVAPNTPWKWQGQASGKPGQFDSWSRDQAFEPIWGCPAQEADLELGKTSLCPSLLTGQPASYTVSCTPAVSSSERKKK